MVTPRGDLDLVRRLLADQHPDLSDRPLTTIHHGGAVGQGGPGRPSGDGAVGAGNGAALLRLGQHFAVRLPLDRRAADRLERETRLLAEVAARTGADAGTRTTTGKGVQPGAGVAVPRQVRAGDPTDYYPWRWSIVRWIAGRPATGQAVRARAFWSPRLARFVADLHGRVPGEATTGEVPAGGLLTDHDATVGARLADPRVVEALDGRADDVRRLWEQLLNAAPSVAEPVSWVHGRLDPGHLLVERGRLAGVTGFGGPGPDGVGPGDPAADLAAAWLNFELEGRVGFVVRYSQLTGADDGWWLRARAWTVVRATALLAAGPVGGDVAPEEELAAAAATGAHAISHLLDAPDALGRLARHGISK